MVQAKSPDILNPNVVMGLGGRYTNKYFASNQTLIFIGPYLVDEAVACAYRFAQPRIPIYGYSDQYYQGLGSGKKIVQGSLTLNYIDSGYLFYVMYESLYKLQRGGQNTVTSSKSTQLARDHISNSTAQLNALLGKIYQDGINAGNTKNQKLNTNDMRNVAQLIALNPVAGQRVLDSLRNKFWGTEGVAEQRERGGVFGSNIRAVDTHLIQQGIGTPPIDASPDQLPPINITVSHGNPTDKSFSTYRVIRDVTITDVSMQMGPSGQPQTETYQFMARSLDT